MEALTVLVGKQVSDSPEVGINILGRQPLDAVLECVTDASFVVAEIFSNSSGQIKYRNASCIGWNAPWANSTLWTSREKRPGSRSSADRDVSGSPCQWMRYSSSQAKCHGRCWLKLWSPANPLRTPAMAQSGTDGGCEHQPRTVRTFSSFLLLARQGREDVEELRSELEHLVVGLTELLPVLLQEISGTLIERRKTCGTA
jgi:hypothetical protein